MTVRKKTKRSKLRMFLGDLYAMLIESDSHYADSRNTDIKLKKNIAKSKHESIDQILKNINISDLREHSRSKITTSVVSASLFSYMHSTFEKYMMSLISDSINSNTKFKNAYTNKIKSTAKRDDFKYLIDYLDSPKKRLSRLNDVSRGANGIINLSRDLLSMTGVEIGGDRFEGDRFEYAYLGYIESRETNNILKHRNDIYDKEYVDRVIKTSKQISKKVNDNELFRRVKSEKTEKGCTKENIIGQRISITPVIFINAFRCIIFLASYFIKYFSITKDKMTDDINHIAHTLMFLCKDIPGANLKLLSLSEDVSSLVEDNSMISFNNILAKSKYIQSLEDRYFIKQNRKLDEKSRETIKDVLDKNLTRIKKLKFDICKTPKENKLLNGYYQKILELYCRGEKDEMIKNVFDNDVISKNEFQSWALFVEFHNDDIFLKKFKKKFKSKFEPESSVSGF